MIALSFQARRLVGDLLKDVRERPRYRGGYVIDDEGGSHAWGAVDCERYGECVATKRDVQRLAAALRRVGCDLTFDECDGLVSEALWRDNDGRPWYNSDTMRENPRSIYATEAEYRAAKRKRHTERLRVAGLCTMCGTQPVTPGRSNCAECCRKANARKKKKVA